MSLYFFSYIHFDRKHRCQQTSGEILIIFLLHAKKIGLFFPQLAELEENFREQDSSQLFVKEDQRSYDIED